MRLSHFGRDVTADWEARWKFYALERQTRRLELVVNVLKVKIFLLEPSRPRDLLPLLFGGNVQIPVGLTQPVCSSYGGWDVGYTVLSAFAFVRERSALSERQERDLPS